MNLKFDELDGAVQMFRKLLPHSTNNASIHSGEEGRFVESVLTEFLRENLPSRLTVATGFVVDLNRDLHSKQTDILVYDSSRYAPYLKYGDAVVIPPESVIAAISVKEKFKYKYIKPELKSLQLIGEMCGGYQSPAPYLSLFGFDADIPKDTKRPPTTSWEHIEAAYPSRKEGYSANELIDSIIVYGQYYIRKNSWTPSVKDNVRKQALFGWSGANKEHRNAYLQELIHAIHERLSGRDNDNSPKQGTKHFPKIGWKHLGSIDVHCHNR